MARQGVSEAAPDLWPRSASSASSPDAPALIVEGEKCADIAAQTLHAAMSPSRGRGGRAIGPKERLGGAFGSRCHHFGPMPMIRGNKAVPPRSLGDYPPLPSACGSFNRMATPMSWDIGDAVGLGWDAKKIATWAAEHIRVVSEDLMPPAALPVASPKIIEQPPANYDDEPRLGGQLGFALNLDTNQGGLPHNTIGPMVFGSSKSTRSWPARFGMTHIFAIRSFSYPCAAGAEMEWTDADDLDLTVFIQQQLKLNKFNTQLIQALLSRTRQQNPAQLPYRLA